MNLNNLRKIPGLYWYQSPIDQRYSFIRYRDEVAYLRTKKLHEFRTQALLIDEIKYSGFGAHGIFSRSVSYRGEK